MLYREAGQFRTSYAQDTQLFPLRQDRIGMVILLVVGFLVVPFIANDYWPSLATTSFCGSTGSVSFPRCCCPV